jgi:hypothetical protein
MYEYLLSTENKEAKLEEIRMLEHHQLYYISFALIMFFIMILFVPKTDIRRLFWFGLLWGSVTDFVFETVYVWLNILRYEHTKPFNIGGLSVWTILAWTPASIMFIYFLPKQKEKYTYWLYLISYSWLTSTVSVILSNLGLLKFIHWSPVHWFIAAIVILYVSTKHYESLRL